MKKNFILLLFSFLAGTIIFAQPNRELLKKLHIKKTIKNITAQTPSVEETYYNSNGNDSLLLINGNKNRSYTYTYDSKKRILTSQEYKADDKLWIEDTYTYNTDGSYQKANKWLVGTVTLTHIFLYNSKGKNIKTTMHDGIIFEYKYDDKGNEISFTRKEGDKVQTIATANKYNKENQLIEKNGPGSKKVFYKYNDKGLVIEEKITDEFFSPGQSIIYQYKYE